MKKTVLAVGVSTTWIVISEFLRNEFLLKGIWVEHYKSLGLVFETLPINGIIWVLWSIGLSLLLFHLMQKVSFRKTLVLTWISVFLMMWLTMYNLQVLPMRLLLFAAPLSLLELAVAMSIIQRIIRYGP